ncbi:MAG: hypothetical protein VZR09_07920 [Candidatus Gastranaerophilaceae bacterium]|nr:hypothetical protein [Candidatus Gastranaerophilaceae bacterium]
MKTQSISQQNFTTGKTRYNIDKPYFNGNLIFPEKLTPNMQKFKDFAEERIMNIIKDTPFDLYVKEVPRTETHSDIGLTSAPKGKPAKMPFIMIYSLSDILHSANEELILEKATEAMDKLAVDAEKIMKSFTFEPLKQKKLKTEIYRPVKIGQNSQIKTKAKSNINNPRRKH